MEITLSRQAGTQMLVTCDGQPSHSFDLRALVPDEKTGVPQPLADPVKYGKAIYQALFPAESAASNALNEMPERILLIPADTTLDSIPWEYAYGRYGAGDADSFLVLECPFVRGLPAEERIAPPAMDRGLHIVAIPSNPLHKDLAPLNIDGEWTRLKRIIGEVPFAITLERARPPTLEQVRNLVANQRQRVLHFMGHGGSRETGAVLCFEKENGDLDAVMASDFVKRVRGTVFLVTLNACVSATPGETSFSNLAAALVRQKTPYALGMRFSIVDDDARDFSRTFYSELARGSSVEEALFQARLTLANSPRTWAIGVPVLYTALAEAAAGFSHTSGIPTILEHQPALDAIVLPRAEHVFQGRIDELKQLGEYLTGDSRPRIVTIHGSGGQGKTALAREAVERFAHAWPGGVWATTLETLPGKEVFVNGLARFLDIATQDIVDPDEIERRVLHKLNQQSTLIVLDNAETLVEATRADNEAAITLARFIRERLLSPMVSLLVTSRDYLGWDGEVGLKKGDLEGLAPDEGASLFHQSAPQRKDEIDLALAKQLSRKVDGHPFSLRLLGGAFNGTFNQGGSISLSAFVQDCETHLLAAKNKYVGPDHRHRTLYACIETSERYLDKAHRRLFSGLWLFHAPFLPETAAAIFDSEHEDSEDAPSPIYDQLYALWQRGLLVRETATLREGTLRFYRLLPTMRPYIEKYLAQDDEREKLLTRFGEQYAQLARFLYGELNRGGIAALMALQSGEDLERGLSYVTGVAQGYYLLRWGWVLQRLGDTRRGLKLTEQALEIGQKQDQQLELLAINNIAAVYRAIGQPQRALELCQQALPLMREVGDRAGEATTLHNIALVYRAIGQPQRALELCQQALPLMREVGDRAGEATTLNNIALVYQAIGQPQRALELYQQALPLRREVGDRAGEATTLNNMGMVYRAIGQPQRALELCQQALPLRREAGDRAGEATTLNNIALVYQAIGQPQQALELYQQALPLTREVGDRAGEVTTLSNIAILLYQHLNRPQDAISKMEQVIAVMVETGLPRDAAGRPLEELQRYLNTMRQGPSPDGSATMSPEQLRPIIANTIVVMTTMQDRRDEWREAMTKELQDAQQRGTDWQIEVDFFTTVLAILDGKSPDLPGDHPYAQAVVAIQDGIVAGVEQGGTAS